MNSHTLSGTAILSHSHRLLNYFTYILHTLLNVKSRVYSSNVRVMSQILQVLCDSDKLSEIVFNHSAFSVSLAFYPSCWHKIAPLPFIFFSYFYLLFWSMRINLRNACCLACGKKCADDDGKMPNPILLYMETFCPCCCKKLSTNR